MPSGQRVGLSAQNDGNVVKIHDDDDQEGVGADAFIVTGPSLGEIKEAERMIDSYVKLLTSGSLSCSQGLHSMLDAHAPEVKTVLLQTAICKIAGMEKRQEDETSFDLMISDLAEAYDLDEGSVAYLVKLNFIHLGDIVSSQRARELKEAQLSDEAYSSLKEMVRGEHLKDKMDTSGWIRPCGEFN